MLNPFPIQFLALFAYFLLRLFVGGVLVFLGLRHVRQRRELVGILLFPWFPYGRFLTTMLILTELGTGVLILLGAYTQYAALVIMLLCIKVVIFRHTFNDPPLPSKLFYVLLFGAVLTLFITGAGALAFDLPI